MTCKMLLKVNYLVADKDKSLMFRVFYRSGDDLFVRVCRIPVNLTQEYFQYDVLRNFVPFGKLKKREKHSWRSVTFSKNAGF